MHNILCFGDSNTFGTNPGGGRWLRNERWTGILQELLGPDTYVIEEGHGGRTMIFDDPLEQDKNGRDQLRVALRSHRPLDVVILMLGTNDMKHRFQMLPIDLAVAAGQLGQLVERYDYGEAFPIPRVMLISPIELGEGVSRSYVSGFSEDAVQISRQLGPLYRAQAEAHGWLFLDAAAVARPCGRDKVHMEKEDHLALAQAIAHMLKKEFG